MNRENTKNGLDWGNFAIILILIVGAVLVVILELCFRYAQSMVSSL